VALVGAVLASSVSLLGAAETPSLDRWESALGRQHPLAGTIWDVAGARPIEAPTLKARLAAARFILLGERHDNADHHRLQAWTLQRLVDEGRRPAVVFEMLNADDQPAVDRYLAGTPADAAGLGDAVDWNRSGWPPFAMYRPIAEAAISARLPLAAGNLSRADLRTIREGGLAAFDAARRARLGLDRALAPEARTSLAAEIQEAHCGHAPATVLPRMIDVQRARDAQMADVMLTSGAADGALLIAGAGHVRNDRGVPHALRARAPGTSTVSVAFVEVRDAVTTPAVYAARFDNGVAPFDYLWFTPRVDDLDPCVKFRRSLEQLRSR
jgi:uncharacterized iron-regulated protein